MRVLKIISEIVFGGFESAKNLGFEVWLGVNNNVKWDKLNLFEEIQILLWCEVASSFNTYPVCIKYDNLNVEMLVTAVLSLQQQRGEFYNGSGIPTVGHR